MIDEVTRHHGNNADWLVTCDGRHAAPVGAAPTPCSSSIDAMNCTFGEAVIAAKKQGWRLVRVYSTWQHLCPECRGK